MANRDEMMLPRGPHSAEALEFDADGVVADMANSTDLAASIASPGFGAARRGGRHTARALVRNRQFRSLTASVVQALKNDIVRAAYLPGAKLRIAELAEFYGVSPGAVREALSRLVPEGLVEFNEQRGFRAAAVSQSALMDITRARILIDSEALRGAIRHGTNVWEKEVMECCRKLGRKRPYKRGSRLVEPQWLALHQRFHRLLVASCGSDWLLRFHDLLFEQTERYRALAGLTTMAGRHPTRNVNEEHRAIAEAAVGRDARRATALLEQHYLRTAEVVCRSDLAWRSKKSSGD